MQVRDRVAGMVLVSHPTQYGSMDLANRTLDTYMGFTNYSSGLTPSYEPDRWDVQGAEPIPTCAPGNLVLLRNKVLRFSILSNI